MARARLRRGGALHRAHGSPPPFVAKMSPNAMNQHAAAGRPAVGQSIGRVDGPAKLTGQARYVDDVPPRPGELFGRTVRSRIPRGRIKAVRLDPSFDWAGLTVVTAADVPHNV